MKIIFLAIVLLPTLLIAQNDKIGKFEINGKINSKNRVVYLVWYDTNENRIVDSAQLTNGKFRYAGIIEGYTDRFYIKFNPQNKHNDDSLNNVQIPIDNSVMNLELQLGKFSKYKLWGCKSCEQLKSLDRQFKPYYDLSEAYQKIIEDSMYPPERKNYHKGKKLKIWAELSTKVSSWVENNNSNSLAPYLIDSWRNNLSDLEIERLYYLLSDFQKKSFFGNNIQKLIEFNFFKNNQLGKEAPDINSVGVNSSLVSLKEINFNNYVLLDFWASWCKPCRESHPDLISIFKKYKNNSFQIVGIGDDDNNEEKWRNAIQKDSISIWPNILRGFRNEGTQKTDLHKLYFIKSLPTKILIDKSGKIIGRFEGEEGLDNFKKILFEIFKY